MVGCGTTKMDPIVEKTIRQLNHLNKPEGELTKADLENVTALGLGGTKITDAGLKEVAKLQKLEVLAKPTPKSPTKASRRWPSCRSSNGFP